MPRTAFDGTPAGRAPSAKPLSLRPNRDLGPAGRPIRSAATASGRPLRPRVATDPVSPIVVTPWTSKPTLRSPSTIVTRHVRSSLGRAASWRVVDSSCHDRVPNGSASTPARCSTTMQTQLGTAITTGSQAGAVINGHITASRRYEHNRSMEPGPRPAVTILLTCPPVGRRRSQGGETVGRREGGSSACSQRGGLRPPNVARRHRSAIGRAPGCGDRQEQRSFARCRPGQPSLSATVGLGSTWFRGDLSGRARRPKPRAGPGGDAGNLPESVRLRSPALPGSAPRRAWTGADAGRTARVRRSGRDRGTGRHPVDERAALSAPSGTPSVPRTSDRPWCR